VTESLSELKYIVFFATLLIGVPLGYFASLKFPIVERVIFFFMIFFTVRMEDINFVSRETLRLTSRGFEIGMVDIATLIIFFLVMKRRNHIASRDHPEAGYISCTSSFQQSP
jgi:hypothetical protein